MFEASGRGAPAARAQTGCRVSRVDDEAGRWRRRRRASGALRSLAAERLLGALRRLAARRGAQQAERRTLTERATGEAKECRASASLGWDNPCLWAKLWTSSRNRRASAAGRKRPSKTALVLGGGGFTGGVYEIGALRALDLLAVNSTVNNFDVYVGTSAGAFVASMLANGVTPDEMMRVINRRDPSELEDLDLGKVLKPNYLGFIRRRRRCRCARWSWRAAGRGWARSRRSTSASASPRRCRPAFTPAAASPTTSSEALSEAGRLDDFRLLDRELYLTATDLDTCERIVFGEEGWDDVPISKAIQCSTALPIVYKPVDLKGRQLVDGGIRSTTNVDIAVEKGAKFIVVVNPLVPYVNDFEKTIPTVFGTRVRRVSDMGLPAIANQTFRLIAHARLHEAVDSGRSSTPASTSSWSSPSPTTS